MSVGIAHTHPGGMLDIPTPPQPPCRRKSLCWDILLISAPGTPVAHHAKRSFESEGRNLPKGGPL